MGKKETVFECTIEEFLVLNKTLDNHILAWINKEISGGIDNNTKLQELLIFNMKLLYSDTDNAKKMIDFMLDTKDGNGDESLLHSRIQDLYISICLSFPGSYIMFNKVRHMETLEILGYDTDGEYKITEYGWLLFRIQDLLRYKVNL